MLPQKERLQKKQEIMCLDWRLGGQSVGSQAYPFKEQCIPCKYGVLNWVDPDHQILYTVHLVKGTFEKKQEENTYDVWNFGQLWWWIGNLRARRQVWRMLLYAAIEEMQ